MSPFDLTGPSFLLFYFVLILGGAALALGVRWWLRTPAPSADDPPPDLAPAQVALLAGGRKLAVDAAIANLVQRDALKLDATQKKLTTGDTSVGASSEIESAIVLAVSQASEGATIAEARKAATSAVDEVEHRLMEGGLVPRPESSLGVRLLPLAIMGLVVLCGGIKIAIGLERNKPVEFLVIMTVATGIVSLFLLKKPQRTRKGDAVLDTLKRDHAALETTARSSPDQLSPADWSMAWCLYGYPMMLMSPWSGVYSVMQPPAQGGSGCGGGASCGSSCGGGGGDGGGGGGCGGCGGGGGD